MSQKSRRSRKPERCSRCGFEVKKSAEICGFCQASNSPAATVQIRPQANFITEFFRGAVYFPRGFVYLVSKPALWPAAAIPTILSIFCFVVSFFVAGEISSYLTSGLEDAVKDWYAVFRYLAYGGIYLLRVLHFLVIPLITAWLFSIFGRIVYMPVMEILSAQTEKRVLGDVIDEQLTWKQIFHHSVMSLVNALGLVAVQLLIIAILIPVLFIPIFGSLIWFIVPGVLMSSMDFTDLNFVRRRYGLRERLAIWWARKYRFLGFGFAFFVFLSMPILNILTGTFVIPIACVGGTLLFLELDVK